MVLSRLSLVIAPTSVQLNISIVNATVNTYRSALQMWIACERVYQYNEFGL